MGICCTRNESMNDEILNPSNKNEYDFFDSSRGPELSFESLFFSKGKLNIGLNNIITNLNQVLLSNIKKINFIELWNISLIYKENHTSSNYLVYDLRDHSEKTENFLKKMKHINYSYDELKILSNDKLSNLKRFISKKNIIFIFPEDNIELSSEIVYFIADLKCDICAQLLNTTLHQDTMTPSMNKLLNFIEEKEYSTLPFILFYFSHLTNMKKEGFAFLSIIPFNEDNSSKFLLQKFKEAFSINTLIYIKKKCQTEISIDEPNRKEFIINGSVSSLINNKDEINEMCCWLREEMEKGHSFEIIINETDSLNEDDWISVILLILWKLMVGIPPTIIINYLEYKCMFIHNFKLRVLKNKEKIKLLFKEFGLVTDILL